MGDFLLRVIYTDIYMFVLGITLLCWSLLVWRLLLLVLRSFQVRTFLPCCCLGGEAREHCAYVRRRHLECMFACGSAHQFPPLDTPVATFFAQPANTFFSHQPPPLQSTFGLSCMVCSLWLRAWPQRWQISFKFTHLYAGASSRTIRRCRTVNDDVISTAFPGSS